MATVESLPTVESAERTQMNVYVPVDLYASIKALAKDQDRTIAGIVRNALRMYVSFEAKRD